MADQEQVDKYPSSLTPWVSELHVYTGPQRFPEGSSASSTILAMDLKHTSIGWLPGAVPARVLPEITPHVNNLCSNPCPQGLLLRKPNLRQTIWCNVHILGLPVEF